jgi:hypothetical protein
MKNITLTMFFVLALIQLASPQEVKFAFQTGLGTYSMDGLKNLNCGITDQLQFDSKTVSDFPAYFYFRPSIVFNFKNLGIGLINTFQSTGSRVSAKDYSGEYHYDMKVHSNTPGIYFEYKIANEKMYSICFYSIMGVAFSKLETLNYLNVFNSLLTNEKTNYKAQNLYLEQGINCIHSFNYLSVGINLGYLLQFENEAFYTGGDKKNTLYDSVYQVSIKPNWNGIRAGLVISYSFIRPGKITTGP